MENKECRGLLAIADEIITVIKNAPIKVEKADEIIGQIERIKKDHCYRAPEAQFISWNELAEVLSKNFVPSNSKWETEIMIIFNDLSGSVDDYWDGDENE